MPLREYLLCGKGWKILYVVNFIGVHNLNCCRELSNLLISLIPVSFKLQNHDESVDTFNFKPEFNDVDSCFGSLLKSVSHKHFMKTKRKVKNPHRRKISQLKVKTPNSSESDVDSTRTISPNSYLHHLENLIDNNDIFLPESDTDLYTSISAPNLSCLILELLQKISFRDILKRNLTTSPPSFTILPFALDTLTSLYVDPSKAYADNWSASVQLDLNETVLKLVFITAAAVVVQPGGLDVLEQQNNTIKSLMKLAEQVYKLSIDVSDDFSDPLDQKTEKNVFFLFNILYGSLKLVCHIIEWLDNKSYCGQVIRVLWTLTILHENVWCCLSKLCRPNNHGNGSSFHDLLKSGLLKLIQHVEHIIITIKRLKVIHIHNSRCLKKRHKKCHIENVNHHHHNILGYPSSNVYDNSMTLCVISYFCNVIISMFAVTTDTYIQNTILTSLKSSGICCCIDLNWALDKLLCMFLKCPSTLRPNIIYVAEKVLINQYNDEKKSYSCSICTNQCTTSLRNGC
ncbi:Lysosomal-trafficking regulator [Nymphon striatum]|nr:Lysosomal-trafficking regulator [Nymphon striatum]